MQGNVSLSFPNVRNFVSARESHLAIWFLGIFLSVRFFCAAFLFLSRGCDVKSSFASSRANIRGGGSASAEMCIRSKLAGGGAISLKLLADHGWRKAREKGRRKEKKRPLKVIPPLIQLWGCSAWYRVKCAPSIHIYVDLYDYSFPYRKLPPSLPDLRRVLDIHFKPDHSITQCYLQCLHINMAFCQGGKDSSRRII